MQPLYWENVSGSVLWRRDFKFSRDVSVVALSNSLLCFQACDKPVGKSFHLQRSLEICINSPASLALLNTICRNSIRLSLHCFCKASETEDFLSCSVTWRRPFAWTVEGWKLVSEEATLVCRKDAWRKRQDKGGKVGTKRKGTGTKRR